jgi:hypothetical protein
MRSVVDRNVVMRHMTVNVLELKEAANHQSKLPLLYTVA